MELEQLELIFLVITKFITALKGGQGPVSPLNTPTLLLNAYFQMFNIFDGCQVHFRLNV